MDAREFAGLDLAARAKITWNGSFWLVPSQSSKGWYRVDAEGAECTCEDFELRQLPCKHVHAIRILKRQEMTPRPVRPVLEAKPEDKPKRPTYKQNWPAYNAAQTNEKRLFLGLLADLCGTVSEPERKPGPGRKPVPIRDALFAALFKVYSGMSGRRFMSDLEDASDKGHVGVVPHYNFIFKVLEDEATFAILRELVTRSSLPLAAVETAFAIDSSGFGSSRFEKWHDTKYGIDRKRATWVKTHICVGVKSNVVTAVEIGDAHDGQMFPGLTRTTADHFTIEDMTADKAYLDRKNLELVEAIGGTAYIPFKKLCRSDLNGATWEKMFHLFAAHREDFLKHYHQRSNVESTFSAVKRKFGDSVRSKTPTAMNNEVLAKLICHNVVVCIHEAYELKIDIGIVGAEESEDEAYRNESEEDLPRVIRFPGA